MPGAAVVVLPYRRAGGGTRSQGDQINDLVELVFDSGLANFDDTLALGSAASRVINSRGTDIAQAAALARALIDVFGPRQTALAIRVVEIAEALS